MNKFLHSTCKRVLAFALAFAMVFTSVVTTDNAVVVAEAAGTVSFSEAQGYEEGAYAEWAPVSGANGYKAYVSKNGGSYIAVDNELIREYASYWRVDAVGLSAGTYKIKVEAVDSSKNVISSAETGNLTVTNYDRSGFAFSSASRLKTGSGAYNDDGTLKSNAQVIYVTPNTAKTVTATIGGATITGFQAILDAKAKDPTPLCIRIVGCVKAANVDKFSSSSEGIQIKGSSAYTAMNTTIEGIGEDAAVHGFGFLVRNAGNVEFRNFAVMCFMDDGISMDTANTNIWIHDMDLFYGSTGGDADQAKGDGTVDLKGDSQYITIAYNHFWDAGKASLCGMKSESGPNYITYHHNWFDHSDSRHPRIRTMSVHVYNNYYKGVSKYGVGAAQNSDAFVEANYFENCHLPMLSSMQGSDISVGDGIFSGENGGIIKAYNNIVVGATALIYQNSDAGTGAANATEFDAYLVSSRSEKVPSSVSAKQGGHVYNNFDTSIDLGVSEANITNPADVPTVVTAKAGRLNGGDFQWTFTDADNTDYAVNSALKSALVGYNSPVKSIGGINGVTGGGGTLPGGSTSTEASTAPTEGTGSGSGTTVPTGGAVHNFTTDDKNSSFYTITGNLSTSKGTVNYNGASLTQCLKMESTTNISFNAASEGTLVLVFGGSTVAAGKRVKVDGTAQTADANGVVSVKLAAGSHTITKSDSINLFYMTYVSEGSVAPTEATQQPTEATQATTAPTEATQQPTEATQQPTEATQATTAPTEATQQSTEATEATTAPSEPEVVVPGNVAVKKVGGWNEMIYMELSGVDESNIKGVSYTGPVSGSLSGQDLDYLVRNEGGVVRIDLLGLKAGNYNVTVSTSKGDVTASGVYVNAQDRSGYAHFNNTEGVGAYNDDGTLKDNAIVLYVTDANKNTVTLNYKGITVSGIGNILNSVGQACGEPGHENECKKVSSGKTYYGTANTNQGILKILAEDNVPLVVRFIGIVSNTGLYKPASFNASSKSLINGLTEYNTVNYGGSVGDNGHMARMKSAKNVTFEGVGVGATIDGWGFHFIAESSATTLGKNFEVRNLTFINTPEDAIGMEGVQEGEVITASVERCWVHNNEFYCPNIGSPAESDKAQGDGSVDFKRGNYFTCSYNYFEGCHKTNLVGSSDSSLQYNLTYHHNHWYRVEARAPLARRANIHMYNNMFEEQTSYAMDARANSFIFSEYNMFYKAKNAQTTTSGGAIKSYNDSFATCINDLLGTVVSSKTQAVSNSCAYTSAGINYSKFETTASQSYIPGGNYDLQENVTEARKVIEAYGGTMEANPKTPAQITMSDISVVPDGVTPQKVTTFPATYAPGKITKTVFAFTVGGAFNIDMTVTGGVLVNEAGEVIYTGSGTVNNLPAGTYMIQPINFQAGTATTDGIFKEVTISNVTINAADPNAHYHNYTLTETVDATCTAPGYKRYTCSCGEHYDTAIAQLAHSYTWTVITPATETTEGLRRGTCSSCGTTKDEIIPVIGTVSSEPGGAGVTGGMEHNYTTNGKNSTFYTITGNLSTSKGTVTYGGLTLTQCLKMESTTNISFNAANNGTLVLVFGGSTVASGKRVSIDGTAQTADANGVVSVKLAAGSHTITKTDSINLFYMTFVYDTETTEATTAPTETTEATTAPTEATEATTAPTEATTAPTEATEATTAPTEATEASSESGDETLNGIEQAPDGNHYYYTDGKVDTTKDGLVYYEEWNEFVYLEKGEWVTNKVTFVEYGGGKFLVDEGTIATTVNGLYQDSSSVDTWYFLSAGQVQSQVTGLVQYNGAWFYLINGVKANDYNDFVDYNGGRFLVAGGQLQQHVNNLYLHSDGNWYYLSGGQIHTNYTGLVNYGGAWFYVANGMMDIHFTGNVEYNGAWFYVENGAVVM